MKTTEQCDTLRDPFLISLHRLKGRILMFAMAGALSWPAALPAENPPGDPFTKITDSPIVMESGVGVSWGDYDNDGFIDLYCGGTSQNLLFHNNGDGTFSKIGDTNAIVALAFARWNVFTGIWADYDNDGLLDLFVPTGWAPTPERNQLFHNLGHGEFALVTNSPVGTDVTVSFSAAWGDFNGDGRLDLCLANFFSETGAGPGLNYLYFGKPDGTFDRADPNQFLAAQDYSVAVTAADYDGDGLLDLAFGASGVLVIAHNHGPNGFDYFSAGGSGLGIAGGAWGDYDNDGKLDLYVAYRRGASGKLLRNDGTGSFEDIVDGDLLAEPGRASGAAWGDYDNDGWLDLFVPRTAYYAKDGDQNDSLWHNNGNGTFTRVSTGSIGNDGVESNGAAWGDYDNDGFLDLVVGCLSYAGGSEQNLLYHNNGNANNWLVLRPVGTRSNRSAIGAKVRVTAQINGVNMTQLREIGTGNAWGQNDPRAHFGLGDATNADVRIEWPSGQVTLLTNVAARQFLTLTEPDEPIKLAIEIVSFSVGVRIYGRSGMAVILEQSPDLQTWTEIARLTIGDDGSAVRSGSSLPEAGFFRARAP